MSHDGPLPPRWEPGEPTPPASGLEGLFGDQPPAAGPPPDPTADQPAANPYADPFVPPSDPATVAAEHQAAQEAALASRASGAHRARPGPARYVLPAVVGALVLVAVGIGVAGWIGDDGGNPSTAVPTTSLRPPASTSSSSPSSGTPSTTGSPSTSPTPSGSPTPAPSSKPSVAPTPKPSATGPVRPPVVHAPTVVLNETREHGLAARVAAHLTSLGWTVTGVGNWRGSIPSTTVYYPPGMEAAARSLAYDLGVDRIRPRVAGMLRDRLTAVLTSDPLA